jgi:hypothetical protein
MDMIFRWATPAQGGAADQNRAGGRTPTTGKAARSSPPGPGRAQTQEREQVSRGDIAAHERGRRASHANNGPLPSGTEEEARY